MSLRGLRRSAECFCGATSIWRDLRRDQTCMNTSPDFFKQFLKHKAGVYVREHEGCCIKDVEQYGKVWEQSPLNYRAAAPLPSFLIIFLRFLICHYPKYLFHISLYAFPRPMVNVFMVFLFELRRPARHLDVRGLKLDAGQKLTKWLFGEQGGLHAKTLWKGLPPSRLKATS